jgi:Mannosyltransferase (PIG-V)
MPSARTLKAFLGLAAIAIVWRGCLELVNQTLPNLIKASGGATTPYILGFKFGLARWANWDGTWYYNIATHGYHYQLTTIPVFQTVAFFPGFPVMVRISQFITRIPSMYIGLLINLVICIGISFIIYMLWHSIKTANSVKKASQTIQNAGLLPVVLIFSLPTAFFLAAFYSEAVLVFGVLAAFYFCFKKKYWLSALFIGLATGANPIALVALPALLYIFVDQEYQRLGNIKTIIRENIVRSLGLLIVSLWGMVAFTVYLYFKVKAPLSWYTDEKAWGRGTHNYVGVIWNANYANLFNPKYFGGHIDYLISLSNMAVPVFAVFMLAFAIYKRVWWMCIYIVAFLALTVGSGTLGSINRLSLVLAPCIVYICATVSPKFQRLFWALAGVFLIVQVILAGVFLQGSYFVG